ncbi:hypothetical protein CRG98_040501 [Punica granatum]|uniref:Uncharacterized protein n=1 Tax=Punica granatum TaxID=22663 RepID=A0A2I0I538_PUNGR|nr:hypothetical protein CRG98_040501 [Punica granatum]
MAPNGSSSSSRTAFSSQSCGCHRKADELCSRLPTLFSSKLTQSLCKSQALSPTLLGFLKTLLAANIKKAGVPERIT